MGNSRKEKTSTKIYTILQSGTAMPGITAQEFITIKLVDIDSNVFKKIKLGERVNILMQENRYYCFYNSEILGKIPSSYNNNLRSKGKSRAIIVIVSKNPISVTIKL